MPGAAGGKAPIAAHLAVDPRTSPLQATPVITIGVAAALSGPAESLGWQQVNAVQLAISETNAAGGLEIGGTLYTVAMVARDDQCDPAQSPAVAQALIDAGAVAVVGHTCSGASNVAQPIYAAAGVAMVSASSTWPELTEQGYTTTLRVIARDDAGPIRMANYLYQELGITRTAVVERDGAPSFAAEVFSTAYSALGGTIAGPYTVDPGTYTTTLETIRDTADAGAILYVDTDPWSAGFFSRVSADVVGMGDVPIAWLPIWENYYDVGNYVSAAGSAAAGDCAGFPQRRTEDMPGYDALNQAYVAAGFPNYGGEAGQMGAFAYDDARIILAAIDRADSTDPHAIRDAIAATPPYAGVVGNYGGFDAQGDVIPQWAWIYPFAGPWQPLGGPAYAGGEVSALAVDPTLSGTLYAAVRIPQTSWDVGSTLYRSTDGGASWTPIYQVNESVGGLAANGNLVLAGAYNRDEWNPHPLLYRSVDGGQSWDGLIPVSDGTAWALAIDPTMTATAAVGGGDYPDMAGLLRTTDAGLTWEEVFSYTMPGWYPTVNAVAIHPLTPTLWLLAHDGELGGGVGSFIWRSTDGGDSWNPVYALAQDIVESLIVDPLTPTTIYAGTSEHNLLRSADSGLTWGAVITDGAAGRHLVVDAAGTLYAARGGEVRFSTDGGENWNTAGFIPDGVSTLAVDRGPGALYAGLGQLGVYRSADGGQSWEERNDGLRTMVYPCDIDVAPDDGNRLFAAAANLGGWRSDDGGSTWQALPLPQTNAFAITPQDAAIVFAGVASCDGATIFRSVDGGQSFSPVFTATFVITACAGGHEQVQALAVSPALSTTVYAIGWDNPGWQGNQAVVLRSLDGGLSWTVALTRPAESRFEALAIDPADPDRVYAGGQDCSVGPCQGVLYRTTDGGQSWTLVLTATDGVSSIVLDSQKSYVVYVASHDYALHKSEDAGDTWATIRTCCPSGDLLAIDPYVPSHVYLAGWGYVAESENGGYRFTEGNAPFGQGVPPMNPRALAVDNGEEEQTFYAGFNGVWFRTRATPRAGEAARIGLEIEPPGPLYANGIDRAVFRGLVEDMHGNWVADGTAVTITYDLRGIGEGFFQRVKNTQHGLVQGGVIGVSMAGTVTFTTAANVRATGWVTATFLYNEPAGITITGAPVSMTVGGATGIVTATVSGLHGGSASDGTAVTWETSLGAVVTTTWTAAGIATTTLTTGPLAGIASVTATAGSFSDTVLVEFVAVEHRVYLPIVYK